MTVQKPVDKEVDEDGKVSNCQEELETAYLEDGSSIQYDDDLADGSSAHYEGQPKPNSGEKG